MRVAFVNQRWRDLVERARATAGFDPRIEDKYRRLIQYIVSAPDERSFYALKSLHYEKLLGKRNHQRSMRIDRQWRLILQIQDGDTGRLVLIEGIEDYH